MGDTWGALLQALREVEYLEGAAGDYEMDEAPQTPAKKPSDSGHGAYVMDLEFA